jgi:hypothetical protein
MVRWGEPLVSPRGVEPFLQMHQRSEAALVKGGVVAPTNPLTTVPDMHSQAIEQAVDSIFAKSSLHAKQIMSIVHAVIGISNAAFEGVRNQRPCGNYRAPDEPEACDQVSSTGSVPEAADRPPARWSS